jgi:hypothetical protein
MLICRRDVGHDTAAHVLTLYKQNCAIPYVRHSRRKAQSKPSVHGSHPPFNDSRHVILEQQGVKSWYPGRRVSYPII